MRRLEFYTGILLVLFSLVVCREAYKLSLGRPGVPGPGFVPFLLAAALAVLSAFYLWRSLRAMLRTEEIPLWKGLRWPKIVFLFVLLFAYALLLEKVGFILCTLFFLIAVFLGVDRQKWYWIYLGSPGITFLFYALFKLWLKIQLPPGLLRL